MKVNISIDDVSPHPLSSTKVLINCERLIKRHRDVKFTLFVPVAYWRTIRPGVTTPAPLSLDLFPEFCETMRSLSKDNYEVCYHGLYHGIPGISDNDEFQHLTYQEAVEKFKLIQTVVTKANLEDIFKPVFRPPAWRMSPGSIKAARDCGMKTLALSPKDYAKKTYCNEDENFESVVYYTSNPPFDPLETHSVNEIVYHACEWDKNYLGEVLAEELSVWLSSHDEVEFCWIQELQHGKV